MSEKEIAAAVATIGMAVILTCGIIIFTGSKSTGRTSKNTASHSSASHASENKEPLVDLTGQKEVVMNIQDSSYSKPNIKIKAGTKVTWVNQDTAKHNSMKQHEASTMQHDAPKADEASPDEFTGPSLAKGEKYGYIFNKKEVISYHCATHPSKTASITVVE